MGTESIANEYQLPTVDIYGEVFQIGTGTETSINELTEFIKEKLGEKIQVIHELARRGEIKRNYSDIHKAKTLLGFQPKVRLNEGLYDLL